MKFLMFKYLKNLGIILLAIKIRHLEFKFKYKLNILSLKIKNSDIRKYI